MSAAPAQAPATAAVAVLSGASGGWRAARVRRRLDQRQHPGQLPDGIELGDGLSRTDASSGGSATAQAEAYDLELFGGEVTASIVTRTATATAKGVKYRGSVRDLVVGDRRSASVRAHEDVRVRRRQGGGEQRGAGLTVTLTDDLDGLPGGDGDRRRRRVGDRRRGARRRSRPPTATQTAEPRRPPRRSRPRRGQRRGHEAGRKKRLMSKRFVFPVGGTTRIGGPFGSFRAETGAHQGNDLFADFGTPVVAAADGTSRTSARCRSPATGCGSTPTAATSSSTPTCPRSRPAAVNDRHVEAGTILGYIGNTGDAEPTPPHLHFEIHPNGGEAVDPKRFLVAWQRRAGAALTDTAERPGALVEVRDFIGEG